MHAPRDFFLRRLSGSIVRQYITTDRLGPDILEYVHVNTWRCFKNLMYVFVFSGHISADEFGS